jgi:hypothetical protein
MERTEKREGERGERDRDRDRESNLNLCVCGSEDKFLILPRKLRYMIKNHFIRFRV